MDPFQIQFHDILQKKCPGPGPGPGPGPDPGPDPGPGPGPDPGPGPGPGPGQVLDQILDLVLGQVPGPGPGPGTDFWYALNSTGGYIYICGTVRYSNALSHMNIRPKLPT